jgi:phosphoglycolate phosphatase-like HAD superfamily hydrolase
VNLLFDLDGTLTDPRKGIVRCIQHALVTLGYQPPDASALGLESAKPEAIVSSMAELIEYIRCSTRR